MYKIYAEASKAIGHNFNNGPTLLERRFVNRGVTSFVTDKYTDVSVLSKAMKDVVANLPIQNSYPTVTVKPTITLEAMIDRLNERIEKLQSTSLRELVSSESTSAEPKVVIISFLAILESVKQGSVLVDCNLSIRSFKRSIIASKVMVGFTLTVG